MISFSLLFDQNKKNLKKKIFRIIQVKFRDMPINFQIIKFKVFFGNLTMTVVEKRCLIGVRTCVVQETFVLRVLYFVYPDSVTSAPF